MTQLHVTHIIYFKGSTPCLKWTRGGCPRPCSGGQHRGILSWSLAGWYPKYPWIITLAIPCCSGCHKNCGKWSWLVCIQTGRKTFWPQLACIKRSGRWLPWVTYTLWHLSTWSAEDVRGRSSAGAMISSPSSTLATGCSRLAFLHQNLHVTSRQ